MVMPIKKLKTLPTKQAKESIRKKATDEIKKNPNKLMLAKKTSKPKKEYHKEFKRLMNIYLESCKLVNADTVDTIKLARDELLHHLSLKLDKSYSYAFVYMRQLAITLRQAIADAKKTSVYAIYNWQYLKNLEIWTSFIVENSNSHELVKSLIQPLVQLIVGVIRLRPSARWLPIRLHCLQFLNQINYAHGNLTPVLANIIEIFNSIDFNQKTKRDSKKTINLMVMLHFSTSQLGTFEHLEQTLDQVFQLLVENLAVYATNPAFPEYVVYLISTIRMFSKKCRESMFSKAYRSLVKKIDEHSTFVKKQRALKESQTKIDRNPVWDKFIETYRTARLNELEMMMKATRHTKYENPQDDYEDKEKDFDEEDKGNAEGDESSELDEDEFNNNDNDSSSAAEIDDE